MIVNLDGSEAAWDEGIKNLRRVGMTQGALASARSAIDAASLVFAHSVLDDCAWSYLSVCSLAKPADWEPIIAEKKASFAEFSGEPQNLIREEMIRAKLDELERDPLLMRSTYCSASVRHPKGTRQSATMHTTVTDSGASTMFGMALSIETEWGNTLPR